MAEAAGQVRLVRCPRCENLLPELLDLSLYKCGACGAVLRAKKNGNLEDGLSEVFDEVKGSGQSEEGHTVKVPRTNVETIGGERNLVDRESVDGVDVSGVDRRHNEDMASHGGSTSQPKRMETLPDYGKIKRGKERARRMQAFDDEHEPYFRGMVHNRNRGKNYDLNVNNVRESQAPREPLRSRARGVRAQVGFDSFLYHDEGQSSYDMNTNRKRGEGTQYMDHGLDERARIESLENGRAELLRKLDELKDQITRSCDMEDNKPKERADLDPVMLSSALPDPSGRHNASYIRGGLMGMQGPSKQPLASNGVPQYGSRFAPYNGRLLDSYPQNGWGYSHDFPHCPEINRAEMIRRPPDMGESHRPYPDYCPSYYGDVNPELFMMNQHENFFHQPACSCVHCREKNWRVAPNVDHPGLHNQRFQHGPSNPSFHQSWNPILHQPQGNNCGGSNLRPFLQSQKPRAQHSNDLDSDNDGLDFLRHRKLGLPHRRGRLRYPIAGGAPFVTCDNCFELLKLSRKHISVVKNQQKVKCGACSSIIFFELGSKGFIASVPANIDQVPSGTNEGSNGVNSNSENKIDDLQQNFEKCSVSTGSGRQQDPLSSASSLYDGEAAPENEPSRKHSPSSELPEAEPDVPTEEGSPKNGADTLFDEKIRSKRLENDRESFDITNAGENYVAASGVATEISMNGLSNTYVSQDSVDTNKDHSKGSKGSESFFAALIKKGFKDFGKPNRGADVFVNGHPIPDRAVKRAEKLAGPIQPGDYWYDKEAGFWGVMGHPCLGIIMPNIPEFNHHMPENCAAGNTGVYVNGRELHQRDLDLLAKRGLPITENRYYLLKITGEVVDKQTGEHLDSLGKLAPTVLRARHGFGMKVHRFLGQPKS